MGGVQRVYLHIDVVSLALLLHAVELLVLEGPGGDLGPGLTPPFKLHAGGGLRGAEALLLKELMAKGVGLASLQHQLVMTGQVVLVLSWVLVLVVFLVLMQPWVIVLKAARVQGVMLVVRCYS